VFRAAVVRSEASAASGGVIKRGPCSVGRGVRRQRQSPAALTCGELYHLLSPFSSAGCNLQIFNPIVRIYLVAVA
jgi:hypothetical protein